MCVCVCLCGGLTELVAVAEKLDRVEGNLDKINADVKVAEGTLNEMEKCCGLFVCPWNKSRPHIEVCAAVGADCASVLNSLVFVRRRILLLISMQMKTGHLYQYSLEPR